MTADTWRDQIAETIERELKAHPVITAKRDDPSTGGVIGTFGGRTTHDLADAVMPILAAAVRDAQQRAQQAEAAVAQVRELLDPETEMAVIAYGMRLFSEGDLLRALDDDQQEAT